MDISEPLAVRFGVLFRSGLLQRLYIFRNNSYAASKVLRAKILTFWIFRCLASRYTNFVSLWRIIANRFRSFDLFGILHFYLDLSFSNVEVYRFPPLLWGGVDGEVFGEGFEVSQVSGPPMSLQPEIGGQNISEPLSAHFEVLFLKRAATGIIYFPK